MSDSNLVRPSRKVGITDPLWDTFEQMAHEMGTDRDGLINQAMFMFARLNGFLEAGGARRQASGVDEQEIEIEREAEPMSGRVEPEPSIDDELAMAEPTPAPAPAPASRNMGRQPNAPPRVSREAPLDPPVLAGAKRDSDSDMRRRAAAPTPPPALFEPRPETMDNDPDRKAVAEKVLETAAELERLIKGKQASGEMAVANPDPTGAGAPAGAAPGERYLYVVAEDGEMDKVVKDRFLIGRGKHCDLIINSGKVSREHATIVREGNDYYIEDLGSSNGTWFNKQRIKRRKVEDGDEYFICSEKLKCVVR